MLRALCSLGLCLYYRALCRKEVFTKQGDALWAGVMGNFHLVWLFAMMKGNPLLSPGIID